MSISAKAQAIKETIMEIYEIFSEKEDTKLRDEEFTERIKHDAEFDKNMGKVISFPKKKSDSDNRDISAI